MRVRYISSARQRALFLVLVALSLVAAACSSADTSAGIADGTAATSSNPGEVDSGDQVDTTTSSTTTTLQEDPVVAVAADVGVDDDTIRVGYSLDLSGPDSAEDALLLDGHLARIDAANAAGGVAGREIVVVALDNGGDPAQHQQNLSTLDGDGSEAVVAIGGLTQPALDEATGSALNASELLVVGNREFATDATVPASLVPLRPSVCVETTTGIASLIAAGDGERTQLALFSSDEPWAQASAEVARSVVEELELELVLEGTFEPGSEGEAQGDLLEALLSSDAEMVWVAGSAGFLSEVANILDAEGEDRDWVWGGPSASSPSSLFNSLLGPALAEVYQVSQSGPLVDDPSRSDAREALASVAPELSYGNAGPALLGWEQADLLVAALEQAAATDDLTRAAVGTAGLSLTPQTPDAATYRIELTSDRNAVLSAAGSSGLEELFTEGRTPVALRGLCS